MRTRKIVDFAAPADNRIKLKEKEKRDKYLDIAMELKKTIIPVLTGAFGTVTKWLLKGTGGLGNKSTSGDHRNYHIIENGQNTKKSLGDLKTCCHSKSSERSSALADVKKLSNNKNNNH